MKTFTCSVAQKGFYAGPVYGICVNTQAEEKKSENPEQELVKVKQAEDLLNKKISQNPGSEKNAEIREIVRSILSDPAFDGKIRKNILALHLTAQTAVYKAAEELADELGKADSEYIRSRQDDIRGTAEKLIAVMEGKSDGPEVFSAICGEEISPAQLSSMKEERIGGILTDKGSPNSHTSILAGNLGIPYLYGNPVAVAESRKAEFIILDSETGIVITNPDETTRSAAAERMEKLRMAREEEERALEEQTDYSGNRTKVYANIEGPQDIEALLASGADGVGLFRTEFLFLGRDTAPTEEEQYDAYRKVLEAMGEKEVIIRTMDIGSDKKVSWLKLPEESNPALGMRGARVTLKYEDLLRTQLRALLRAGIRGNLKVMFPMIVSAWEIDALREKVEKTAEELKKEGIPFKVPELGIMIETPAAAVCGEELAEKAAFFSIGTNDLTQYTLALDREASELDRYYAPYHEAVFRLIQMASEGSHKHGRKTGVCGQLGADPKAVKRLIEAGVDELSVPIRKVRVTKKLVSAAEKSLEKEKKKSAVIGEKKAEPFRVAAVSDGELIPMAEILDPVFSEGQLGECFGILPKDGKVYSPVNGTVVEIAETGHAVTLCSDEGRHILVHVGIDTVSLGRKAFRLYVKEGERVASDQLLMEADLEMIRKKGLSEMIIVVALS